MTGRRGASAIEFALILPVFMLLATGVLEWSLYMRQRTILDRASREAARVGAVTSMNASPGPAELAQARAFEMVERGGLDPSTATVTTEWFDLNEGTVCNTSDTLSVTIRTPVPGYFAIAGVPPTVTSTAAMMVEDADCIQ